MDHTEYMRGWRERNRERIRGYYWATDPFQRRAWKVNEHWHRRGGAGRVGAEDLRFVYERDGGRCVFCGIETTAYDHDVPVARGGINERANLALCCRQCNRTKSTQTAAEFRGDVIATCPSGHPRTPDNRRITGTRSFCRPCERARRPPYDPVAAAAYRELRRADPEWVAHQREYKRAWAARRRDGR